MKNTVTLVGFVGNNPEIREAQSGAKIVSLSLATTRSFKGGEGNRQTETEWHRITCFNGTGKSVAEHVSKGAMVMVTGRIHYRKWTDQNGIDRYGCEIIAEQVDFLAKAKDAAQEAPKKRRSKVAPHIIPKKVKNPGWQSASSEFFACRNGLRNRPSNPRTCWHFGIGSLPSQNGYLLTQSGTSAIFSFAAASPQTPDELLILGVYGPFLPGPGRLQIRP